MKSFPSADGCELADNITYLGTTEALWDGGVSGLRRSVERLRVIGRSARRVHRRVGAADRLRQRAGGAAGAGAGSLLHAQRPGGARRPAERRLQFQRRRRAADVPVAARGVAVREPAGNRSLDFSFN